MNIVVAANNHCTQISQVFTAIQLAQLIRMHFTTITCDDMALLTTIVDHACRVLFASATVPTLVAPPAMSDEINAAENAYDIALAKQNQQQLCKQLAFNVTVYQPAKQVLVSQLLLTSSISIYLLLDIHRDGISHSLQSNQHKQFIDNWIKSIMQVLFASHIPTTLEQAIAAAQGFELSVNYMGTMALEGQDPLGEHD